MDVKQSLFITTDLSFLLNQPQKMNICKGENTLPIALVGSEGRVVHLLHLGILTFNNL